MNASDLEALQLVLRRTMPTCRAGKFLQPRCAQGKAEASSALCRGAARGHLALTLTCSALLSMPLLGFLAVLESPSLTKAS